MKQIMTPALGRRIVALVLVAAAVPVVAQRSGYSEPPAMGMHRVAPTSAQFTLRESFVVTCAKPIPPSACPDCKAIISGGRLRAEFREEVFHRFITAILSEGGAGTG